MPKRDSVKISEKVLKRLEERIRKQILNDIGDVVTTKCKEFLEKHCAKSSNNHNWPDLTKSDDWKGEVRVPVVTQEIEFLKNSLIPLQKDWNTMSDKTDHILGSVTFIAEDWACERGVQGVHRTRARALGGPAPGAQKSSRFHVNFW